MGAIGLALFFVLRPLVDFNARAPISSSRPAVEAKTDSLAGLLGFSTDSLALMTQRTQHLNYYRTLKDSVKDELPPPGTLNKRGVNLTGWQVIIGSELDEHGTVIGSNEDLYNQAGRLQMRFDQEGRLYRLRTHPAHSNPTFVEGSFAEDDSLQNSARRIVGEIFQYDLGKYELSEFTIDSVTAVEPVSRNRSLGGAENDLAYNLVFSWTRVSPDSPGPERMRLELKPTLREVENPFGSSVVFGVAVEDFRAMGRYEPDRLDTSGSIDSADLYMIFGSLVLLICLVFYTGIRHINRGQVEWKRALFMMIAITAGVLVWRVIFLVNMWGPFLNGTMTNIYLLNQLLYAASMGLYGGMAYIAWEAMAREEGQRQVRLVDAFWQKRFFFRETGDAVLRGYALGGVLLGLFAFSLYLLDTVFYHSDSQFGFIEPSLQPKLLTMNVGAWVTVWLVAVGHVGVLLTFLREKVTRNWLYYGAGTLLTGLLFAGSASLTGVLGPIWYDTLAFLLLAPAVFYVFRRAGIVSFATGWWVFTALLMATPYLGSPGMEEAYVGWVQLGLLALPAAFGFLAWRYGEMLAHLEGYIPAYQERMANHLRVEKEIEIARESQFKLMPLQPPALEGVDVYGFFIPSFEVGGDYFDYVVGNNGSPDQQVLTMTIADVSGKAMKAAMHAVFTSGLLLSRLHRDRPEAILREVSPTLHARTDRQTFITCIIAQYHPGDRTLSIANAGHCLPILKREGKAEFIRTPDPRYPLGVRSRVAYRSLDTPLREGDFVFLYSDGLPEAVSPQGDRFGYEELLRMIEVLETESRSCSEIAQEIKRKVRKFSDYQLADDTTIICLKV